jgi:hypothetical protein
MRHSSKLKQLTIQALAKRFATQWQVGEGPPDAYATISGRSIALDVAIIAQPSRAGPRSMARLREDRVARRVLRDIESALHAQVPNRKTLILTLGAPIQVPTQLVAALTKLLVDYLQSGVEEREERKTVLGNRVRFRVLNQNRKWRAKVVGFVFSGDPRPGVLGGVMRSFHDAIAAKAKGRMPKDFTGDRWLVLCSDEWIADIKTYRLMYSQLSPPRRFNKVFMLHGARVEPLTNSDLRSR